MTDPSASDRDLLERLNALKPTSVTLDASQNSLGIPIAGSTAVPPSQPVSREDALTARLRSLRLGSSSPSPSPSKEAASASPRAKTQSPDVVTTRACKSAAAAAAAARPLTSIPASLGSDEDKDPLHMDDEEVLNDFLEGLSGDEDFGSASAAAAEPRDEADKVAALLESLGRDARGDRDSLTPRKADKPGGDDDDSEGEEMQSEVSKVLARAADEAELDRISHQQDGGAPDHDAAAGEEQTKAPAASPPQPSDANPNPNNNNNPQPSSEDPFSLPSVPSTLPPPPADADTPTDTDTDTDNQSFESSIAARMAALQGVVAADDGNSLGLPSAPTFAPDARPPSTAYRRTAGRQAYTDEDERTWCVVCLEDAAVRCLGCDGDVYCARCFRDMHVGPAAGYDERGHKSVRFERPRGSR